jgi:hypothetical protein
LVEGPVRSFLFETEDGMVVAAAAVAVAVAVAMVSRLSARRFFFSSPLELAMLWSADNDNDI